MGLRASLNEERKSAADRLAGLSLPTTKSETYRYTSLKPVKWESLQEAFRQSDQPLWSVTFELEGVSPQDQASRRKHYEQQGVLMGVISDPEIAKAFSPWGTSSEDYLDLFSQSTWMDGYVISVPPEVEIKEPIVVRLRPTKGEAVSSRAWISVGQNSRVRVHEIFEQSGRDDFVWIHSEEIRLNQSAQLHHAQLFDLKGQVFPRVNSSLKEAAIFKQFGFFLGQSRGQWKGNVELAGARSEFRSCSAIRGKGSQHWDLHVGVHHNAPQTKSEVDCLTVMKDQSRAIFNGNIRVTPTGKGSDAVQRNRNMLLSRKAEVDTLPKLEIETDDVKCSHGATVSSISEDQLYYLQTRGIPRAEAEAMIVEGFTEPAILAVQSAEFESEIRRRL